MCNGTEKEVVGYYKGKDCAVSKATLTMIVLRLYVFEAEIRLWH